MAQSRAERRSARRPRAVADFGAEAEAVLDALELTEFAWHDCDGAATPPAPVIDDLFEVAKGDLAAVVRAARLAVEDSRDLKLAAASAQR